jgi:hypothetical protein
MKNFRKNQVYSILGVAVLLFVHAHAGTEYKKLDTLKRYKWALGGASIVLSAALIYFLKRTKTEKVIEQPTGPINSSSELIKGKILNQD